MKWISIAQLFLVVLLLPAQPIQTVRAVWQQEKKDSPRNIAIRAGRMIDRKAGTRAARVSFGLGVVSVDHSAAQAAQGKFSGDQKGGDQVNGFPQHFPV